jgi:hypothetical protein
MGSSGGPEGHSMPDSTEAQLNVGAVTDLSSHGPVYMKIVNDGFTAEISPAPFSSSASLRPSSSLEPPLLGRDGGPVPHHRILQLDHSVSSNRFSCSGSPSRSNQTGWVMGA